MKLDHLHEAWTKSVAVLFGLAARLEIAGQATDCASWSHRSRLHHLNAAKPSASCYSQELDSSVCFRIDCVAISTLIQAVRPKQEQESSSIVSWNGNGRKQVIGAFNSNGMPVLVPPCRAPGPSNGSAPMSATKHQAPAQCGAEW